MADEPRWDELFESQPGPEGRRGDKAARRDERLVPRHPVQSRRERRDRETAPRRERTSAERPRRRRGLGVVIALVSVLLVLGVGATAVFLAFEAPIRSLLTADEPVDYEGTGTDEVIVTITDGQVGSDVATTLADADVTRSYEAFYSLLLDNPDVSFLPGSYALRKQMSAQSALDALLDPANKVFTRVTIPEGTTLPGVLERLAAVSDATGVDRAQLDAAAADLASFGLPPEAPSLEGYLFPATYSFDPEIDGHTMLQTLVNEMFARLDGLGVTPADRHRVLTLAALTQKEGGSSDDFFKVARVWENRLAQGQRLESDATVSYGSGGTTISTSDEERADASNPYNTYANDGLPIGPISNPGEVAIQATLAPDPGPWLYFVLIDGETGETAFSETYSEHLANVKIWQQWLREHPGFDG